MRAKTAKKLRRMSEEKTVGMTERETTRYYRKAKANYKAEKQGRQKPY